MNKKIYNFFGSVIYAIGISLVTGTIFLASISDSVASIPIPLDNPTAMQQKNISVTVTDNLGEPLVGAVVSVKGTKRLAVTDINGVATISATVGETIVIKFLGFEDYEHAVKSGDANIKAIMAASSQVIDEVVVVGFGKQKKASVTGAIQTVNASDLRIQSSSLSNSFAGRIPGVIAVQRGGEPGADGSNFWIRGISTFTSNTSPLIFIDNVEVSSSDMNALAPEVIEGFSILKDASATALYGARGANGVVLITTRSGQDSEKARINIRIQNSFTQPTQTLKIADGVDYMIARNYSILNRTPTAQPYFSDDVIDGTRRNLNPYIFPNVDWQDYLFEKFTTTQSANLNVTGGGKRATYFISTTLNNDNGMLKSDKQNSFDNNIHNMRISIQANVGVSLTSTTKANVRINANILDYAGSASGTDAIYRGMFESPGVMFAPVLPALKNEDHILFGNRNGGPTQGRYFNPYADMVRGYSDKSESTVLSSFDIEQDLKFITKGLSVKGMISFKNWSATKVVRSFNPYYYGITDWSQGESGYEYDYQAITKGTTALSTSTSNGGDRLINMQFSMDYLRTFNQKHDVSGMLVYLQRDWNTNAPDSFFATLPTRNQGVAGRLTYGYDNRYLFEANFGLNGSENFEEGNRYGFFPSFSVGYNIANENYFESLRSVVNILKIRGSWGKVGNSATDSRFPYLTYVNLNGGGYIFGDTWQTPGSGAIVTRYGAAGAKWETGVKTNIGLDIAMFNSLSLSVDFFNEERKDIFMKREIIPAESGITGDLRPYANLGKVRNKGVDISLEYNKAFNSNLYLSIKGSFTFAKNELLERDEPAYEWDYLYDVGHPLNVNKGLISLGLFKDEDDVKNSPRQTYSPNLKPGDVKYKDMNNDGQIDDQDMVKLGNPTVPQIVYGFGASLQYKAFSFSIFLQGIAKTSLMMNKIHPFSSEQTTLLDFIAKDYWTETNTDSEYPRLVANLSDHNNFKNSSFWLRDASFIRLKNVEIGYTYKNARLFISGQNLLTFSPFKHWDPELGGGTLDGRVSKGMSYPTLRVATVGLQFTF